MVCGNVIAKNITEAKDEFKRKYSPGYGRKFTTIKAHSWNPSMNRMIKKELGKDAEISFRVCARVDLADTSDRSWASKTYHKHKM